MQPVFSHHGNADRTDRHAYYGLEIQGMADCIRRYHHLDSHTFTMPSSDVTVKAVFEAIVYDVTVQTEGSGTAYATPSSATMERR